MIRTRLQNLFNTRLGWLLWRRRALTHRLQGFRAAVSSNVDSASRFGPHVRLGKRVFIWRSQIGRASYVAAFSTVKSCEIGAFCSIGPEVILGGLARHPMDFLSTHPAFYSMLSQTSLGFASQPNFKETSPVRLGHDVWVGARAMVLDGVRIGNGAVIAAGAVVVGDVPPYAVVGGVPARVLKFRFPTETIARLEATRWWELPDAVLAQLAKEFFTSPLDRIDLAAFEAALNRERAP